MKKEPQKVMKLVRKTPQETMTLTKKADKIIFKKITPPKKESPDQRAPKISARKTG